MLNVLFKSSSALMALFLFVLGNGFFSTYVISELTHQHKSTFLIGLMTTAFYVGLFIGSFRIEKVISRIAHIRAYAAFASALSVIALSHAIITNPYIWLIFRFLAGICTAGIFVVVESWLLSHSTVKTRGQVLSLYMVTFYLSQSVGQFILRLDNGNAFLMFSIISICCSLSVIPLSLTKAALPLLSEPSTLNFKSLYKKSASGLFGCFTSGQILGGFYGLFPIFLIHFFPGDDAIAKYMFAVIFGGMLFQYPLGRLSDIVERRLVLSLISIACLITLIILTQLVTQPAVFFVGCLLFGGFSFSIYPISISYACDALEPEDIIAGTQGLLLAYSIGAMIGPVIAGICMHTHQLGLIFYFIVLLFVQFMYLSWRKTIKAPMPQEEPFIVQTANSPIGYEGDPRSDATFENVHR